MNQMEEREEVENEKNQTTWEEEEKYRQKWAEVKKNNYLVYIEISKKFVLATLIAVAIFLFINYFAESEKIRGVCIAFLGLESFGCAGLYINSRIGIARVEKDLPKGPYEKEFIHVIYCNKNTIRYYLKEDESRTEMEDLNPSVSGSLEAGDDAVIIRSGEEFFFCKEDEGEGE